MAIQQMMLGAGAAAEKTYIDDVFSTYLWTGSGSSTTISNGLNLSGEGGMTWIKNRSNSNKDHVITDTVRGAGNAIFSNSNSSNNSDTNKLASFTSTGFGIGTDSYVNGGSDKMSSWSFRKAPGFFDVVTWTGNAVNSSSAPRQIAHNLGSIPGAIWVKCLGANQSWACYHNSLGATRYMHLSDSGGGGTSAAWWNNTEPTSTHFTVHYDGQVNENNQTYVAYVFAGGRSTSTGGNSISFPSAAGDPRRILCGDSSNTTADFNFGTGDLTIECWMKCNATQGTYPRVVAIGPQWSAEMAAIQWDHDNNANRVTFYCYNHSSSTTDPLLKSSIKSFNGDGLWHHVAVTRSGNAWRLFVDGLLESTATWSGSPTSANSYCTIGNTPGTATTAWFGGYISNVRIVKGTAVYTSSFRVPDKALTAITNTKLLCCNAASATSATVTPITLTETNVVQNQTDNPFSDPAGLVFGENEDQNVIKCGSYVGNGSSTGPEINLGWEPQFIIIKQSSAAGNQWRMYDSMRGMVTGGDDAELYPSSNGEEDPDNEFLELTPTGFKLKTSDSAVNGNTATYIYLAIRRPDGYVGKPAEAGTDVFAIDTGNGNSNIPNFDSTFPVDFAWAKLTGSSGDWWTSARLIQGKELNTNANGLEAAGSNKVFDSNVGWHNSSAGSGYISHMWGRHAGFDVVTYKGDGVAGRQIPHSMNKIPEMMWVKNREVNGEHWKVYHKDMANATGGSDSETDYMILNNSDSYYDGNIWNDTAPTSTHFTVGSHSTTNQDTKNIIAFLFSSVSGVSKVGHYTGNGSTGQTISVGFAPRFLIIKNIDDSKDWYVLDTTRGWDAGNDLYLQLNENAAQASDYQFGAPTTTGFTLQGGGAAHNQSGTNYIYYAHA
jgi:hypothetical protein